MSQRSKDRSESGASVQPSVAVIGAGYWGKNLVRNFSELGVLSAIADADQANGEGLVKKYGGRLDSIDAILADPSITGIVIAAPAETHFAVAKQALEARKHVFVEKPLSLHVKEAEELVAIADRADRRLMVGHLLQYHPAFLKLKQMVRDGELGKLQYIYSNRLNLGKIRREEDILWSFAPHDLSMILSLVGAEPEKVDAVGAYYLHDHIADVTTTHLTFPAGERAHVFVSWLHPFKEQKLVVVGSEAMAVFDDGEPVERKLVLYRHRINWKEGMPTPNKAEAIPIEVDSTEPLRSECQHFLDCITSGATPRTDGREGVRVLKVLERATEALVAKGRAPAAQHAPAQRFPNTRIHESAFIDDQVEIGDGVAIWHFSHVLSRVSIGAGCQIGQNVVIGPDVRVGARCKVQNNVSLYKGVTLEDGVFCGPSCVFTNVNNPRAEVERKSEFRPTLVKRGASIGANATIVCGHTLGEYCFIAAGAVVTGDVRPYAIMAGVPARRIGWMSKHGDKLGDDLVCPSTGERYRTTDDGIEPIG